MAVTNQQSTQYIAEYGAPKATLAVLQTFHLISLPFDFTQVVAGDATSTVLLRRLPAGDVWMHVLLSRIEFNAFGGGRTLAIGHGAYTKFDASTAVASVSLFDAAIDVSGAGSAYMGSSFIPATLANTGQYKHFQTQGGVDILATVAGGTIPDATQLHGTIVIAVP